MIAPMCPLRIPASAARRGESAANADRRLDGPGHRVSLHAVATTLCQSAGACGTLADMPLNDWSDSIVIAELSDEPAFSEDLDALQSRLEEGKNGAVPDVILDMRGVSYLNSTNIAQLLRLRKKLILSNRRLRICAVNDSVWSVLLTTGLDAVFSFTEDVSTSLASLQL
jgi:anti-anti-sigma factor